MRILIQRVSSASVTVNDEVVGEIDRGLVLLVGVGDADGEATADRMAEKVANLRIFNDADGRFNLSLLDVGGGALVVSQFTLFADCRRGRRPSFTEAGKPDHAAPLCEYFAAAMGRCGVAPVATGIFGAAMHVNIQNDGPVTIWIDSEAL